MSFTIYPAIDLRGGKCVSLRQGDYNQETIFSEDPVQVAKEWQRQGAQWIHLVDLDGAKAGRPINDALIGQIAAAVDVPVQVGGGVRSREAAARLLALGVSRIILGTAAIEDRQFVGHVLQQHGDKVAIGIDARDGFVATRGWLETSAVKADVLAMELAQAGAQTFIVTDIHRDGMMGGPNTEAIVQLARATGREVIASGGVSSYADLHNLARYREDGIIGAIVGTALYTGDIVLAEALKRLETKE